MKEEILHIFQLKTMASSSCCTISILLLLLIFVSIGTTLSLDDDKDHHHLFFASSSSSSSESEPKPKPKAWPEQFHSILVMNYSGENQLIDLWYDWRNGRNFNIIQHQLGKILYDLEWNNGTSFFYTLDSNRECSSAQLEVGILRPNWLEGATYLGQRNVDGFLCNVWEKADFITYYEDVLTQRPVSWIFYTGRTAHVMTFEVGAALEDAKWQAPSYCFHQINQNGGVDRDDDDDETKSDAYHNGFNTATTPTTGDVLQQFIRKDGASRTAMHRTLVDFGSSNRTTM